MRDETQNLKVKYLDLLKRMRSNKENLISKDNNEMEGLIENTESLFLQIQKPWDLKLDARISTESAKISSESFEKQCMSDRITSERFIDMILKHNESGLAEITNYMHFAKSRFVGVDFMDQLCLTPVVRETNARQRNVQKVAEDSADFPLRIFSAEDDDGTLTLVKKIKKVVHEKRVVDYYELVLDPDSYPKTIENIFYLAFAIKVGLVHFASRDGRFVVCAEPSAVSEVLNHLIVSIEYGEYCMLVKNLNIGKSMLS